MKYSISMASLVFAVSCVLSMPANAVVEPMEAAANATANCQGALPAFETAIRKRPLAVQNEGTSNSFVTCSFVGTYNSDDIRQVSYFGAFFTNQNAAAVNVTCTAVAGYETNGTNTFISKTVSVPGGGATQAGIVLQPSDNAGLGYYPLVSLSCNIPPGVGINDTYVGYGVDDA